MVASKCGSGVGEATWRGVHAMPMLLRVCCDMDRHSAGRADKTQAYKELQRAKESRQLGAGWEEVDRIFEENGLLFQRISEEAARTLTLLEELSSDESWQMCRDENGIQALYKQKEDSPCHYLQMRGPSLAHTPALHRQRVTLGLAQSLFKSKHIILRSAMLMSARRCKCTPLQAWAQGVL